MAFLRYGLDAIALPPPWSALNSIALLVGISGIGHFLLTALTKRKLLSIDNGYAIICISPIFGSAMVGITIYPIILFGIHANHLLYYFANTLSCIGLIVAAFTLKHWIKGGYRNLLNKRSNLTRQGLLFYCLVILLLIGMGLMSLAPPTDADELNYHLGVPLEILNSGTWGFSPEWFTSRLAGMGEALIALGLSVGAEQFGSLLQYSGLVGIIAMLVSSNKNANKKTSSYLFPLIFISSPVLLWLVSTSKPLLLPIAYTTLSLFLLLPVLKEKEQNNYLSLTSFSIAILLLTCATQMKFNFMLSGFLIGVIWLITMYRVRLFSKAILIAPLISVLVLAPPILWKFIHYGGRWYEGLFKIFPGNWPGYNQFEYGLRNWHESSVVPFPLNLLFTLSPGQFTTIIGVGSLVWVFGMICITLKPNKFDAATLLIASASLGITLIGSIYGPGEGRFYLEPLIWLLLIMAIQHEPSQSFLNNNLLVYALLTQAVITIAVSFLCVYLMFPGTFSQESRSETLNRMAYMHKEMDWVDQNLPKDAVIASSLRAMANLPRQSISLEWVNYVDPKSPDANIYLQQIIKKNVTHLVTNENPREGIWNGCTRGNVIGPYAVNYVSRNPYNKGGRYYVWIAEFNSSKLPECLR